MISIVFPLTLFTTGKVWRAACFTSLELLPQCNLLAKRLKCNKDRKLQLAVNIIIIFYFCFDTRCRKYDNRQSDQQLYIYQTHAHFYMLINDQLGLHSDVEVSVCHYSVKVENLNCSQTWVIVALLSGWIRMCHSQDVLIHWDYTGAKLMEYCFYSACMMVSVDNWMDTKKQGCSSASVSEIKTFTRYMSHLGLLEAPLSIAYLHLRNSSTFWEVHQEFDKDWYHSHDCGLTGANWSHFYLSCIHGLKIQLVVNNLKSLKTRYWITQTFSSPSFNRVIWSSCHT